MEFLKQALDAINNKLERYDQNFSDLNKDLNNHVIDMEKFRGEVNTNLGNITNRLDKVEDKFKDHEKFCPLDKDLRILLDKERNKKKEGKSTAFGILGGMHPIERVLMWIIILFFILTKLELVNFSIFN